MQTDWHIAQPQPEAVNCLARQLNCSTVLATLLINRGLDDARQAAQHLNASIEELGPPPDLPDLDRALQRLHDALRRQETILVFGDYDVDGVTGTALLTGFLRECGAARVVSRLPHRTRDGYGLQPHQVQEIASRREASLILTVDCGISSHAAIAAARQAGIDVIVTDHHTLESTLPEALAVINPKRQTGAHPWADLAGVGVAFGLAISLRAHLREQRFWNGRPEPNLRRCCDLVALGTVADIVPLTGANRVLTRLGLDVINQAPRPGLHALLSLSGRSQRAVEAEDIAFGLAPRLNAAGRMDHAEVALALLLADDARTAAQAAQRLEALNTSRQETEKSVQAQAEDLLSANPHWLEQPVLVLAGEGWHEGVLGIVAARMAQRYHRPALLLASSDTLSKGSARSVAGIDLHAALSQCSALLLSFGGHAMAAGLRLARSNLDALRQQLACAVAQQVPSEGLRPRLRIDCPLPFRIIDTRLLAELEQLKPCGAGHPEPLFLASDITVHAARRMGGNHCRLSVGQADDNRGPFAAMRFQLDTQQPLPTHLRHIAFRLRRGMTGSPWPPQFIIDAWEI